MFQKIRLRFLYRKYKRLVRKARLLRLRADNLQSGINTPTKQSFAEISKGRGLK